jgi:potassium-transporting ATPase ATP-binding subunit
VGTGLEGDDVHSSVAVLVPPPESRPPKVRIRPTRSLFDAAIMRRAVKDSFIKFDPRHMVRNPVMFVVEVGSVWTSVLFLRNPSVFGGLVVAFCLLERRCLSTR